MPYKPIKKGTLLIPSGSNKDPDGHHLHIILTEACANHQHLLVSISTVREGQFHDPACIIEAGEHEFVKDKSFVVYRRATVLRADHIIKCVDGWVYRLRDIVSDDLFDRICEGVNTSRFIPRWARTYYNDNS